MGFADMDKTAAKPNGKGGDNITLTESQEAILKREPDKQKRERIRQKFIETKRRELQSAAAKEPKKDAAKDADGSSESTPVASASGGSSTHSVEVKGPSINVNLPETTVAVHQSRTWGQAAGRVLTWVQTFACGAAAWALLGDGVLRAFGH